MVDPLLQDDAARVFALGRLNVLDTSIEEPFEKIVTLVRTVLAVPISTVTLVDRDRQWFKARRGVAVSETPRSVSFCTHTIQQREPFVVEDAQSDERFASSPLVTGAPHIRSYAGVPLRTPEGYNVGALCAMDTRPRRFSPADVAILSNFANIVCDELELRMIAQVDHLTGALTRRGFLEQAERELSRVKRYGRPSSMVMLDVDHFKIVNDTYGHGAGDQVLKRIAELAGVAIRPTDVFGRLGGEEFAVILSETDAEQALVVAERLRTAIADEPIRLSNGTALRVSASFGIMPLLPSISSVTSWIEGADQMLYAAKVEGRNCTRLATSN
ncbi:diguanylate cyclase with GAF sensor [Sphingomonas sp. PP-CE-3A-406]|uniref:sensor domain-containing diguanylate cyclase n=1 Tax=unclassified Sphingomonas TaxID=196159 RepID=UPI000EF8C167|nr:MULTISPECIES: sensor domain-containing diguanylate cyclase [unclassified Sphingomonas]RMB39187.1 diguanylate cyclase with GAF sensor [Sphingomonas sp. PP-F2F-G114-C0414]RMB54796.1 diguanylate cyclase with GAF sensor [Sphingomonas sp. PP-CE-3A-406]